MPGHTNDDDNLLENARTAVADQEWEKAAQLFTQFLTQTHQHEGSCEGATGGEKVVSKDESKAMVLFERCDVYLKMREFRKAIKGKRENYLPSPTYSLIRLNLKTWLFLLTERFQYCCAAMALKYLERHPCVQPCILKQIPPF